MGIRVYHAKHCKPCEQVTELIKQGRFEGEEKVELVDIETDEGYKEFYNKVLEHGNGAVPSAYRGDQQCLIKLTQDKVVIFDCPTEVQP